MKVTEIRSDESTKHCHELAMLDLADIMKLSDQFIHTNCPACNTEQTEVSFEKDGFKFRTCPSCETMYVSPRPTKTQLSEYYTNSRKMKYWNEEIFPKSETNRKTKIFEPRADQVIKYCKKYGINGNLVDIGAGYGTFCEVLNKRNYFNEVIALEPSKWLAQTCKARHITTEQLMVEDFKPNYSVNVLTCFELIEHLFDPWDFLNDCLEILNPNGLLILTTPNIKGFETQLLGEHSTTIGAPGHLNYFNPWSIKCVLHWLGFEVLAIDTNGELDADLVHRALVAKDVKKSLQNNKMYGIILNDDVMKAEFQELLKQFRISSNMTIVARKL